MQGQLLTRDFLSIGIRETPHWRSVDPAARAETIGRLRSLVQAFPVAGAPNEAVTDDDLIHPVLEILGWKHRLVQQGAGRRRTDVPDCLLFADEAKKAAAVAEAEEHRRYRHGLTFAESKRWQRPLDRGEATDRLDPEVPANQMLRYLSQVEVASDGKIVWGILTNGRHWRLYYQRAVNRSEEFVEFDLPSLLGVPGFSEDLFAPSADEREHLLACFIILFRHAAFLPDPALNGLTFLDFARGETKRWEAGVAKSLSDVVFERVFPRLVQGLIDGDPGRPSTLGQRYADEVREAALIFLYRLLFVLHAEDRDLLPIRDSRYDDYSLRCLRDEIERRIDAGDTFSSRMTTWFGRIRQLCGAIATGDDSIGIPPYNGGLFDDRPDSILSRASLSDAALAPIIDELSRHEEGGRRRRINYRDLSVQQLGSVYENLLEFRVVPKNGVRVAIEQGIYARRVSGSYYTDESLVQLVLARAVGPLVEERWTAFKAAVESLRDNRKTRDEKLAELRELDPASRILELRVCDPAMGSGHFLVSLVDYLSDEILEMMSESASLASAVLGDDGYESPVAERSAEIRGRILDRAREHGWSIRETHLEARHIVRRMLLKRVIYGVDLNPMAVELAKVSLWLHTFTVGAPLSFLDHHLRCGNSLVGSRVEAATAAMMAGGLFGNVYAGMLTATDVMAKLEEMTDADIAEVRESAEAFEQLETILAPYRRLLHLDTAHHWLYPPKATDRRDWLDPRTILAGQHGDPVELLASLPPRNGRVGKALHAALETASRDGFFHWELMFPEVWYEGGRRREQGGFDAIIGNPPWDRVKLQEVEFFAERRPDIASAQTAADRRRMIEGLKRSADPLWTAYLGAAERAERQAAYARRSGEYPRLSGGDVNLYALFVERAFALIRPAGLAGLVVPSGIVADKEKAEFFGSIATSGRLAALFDFENKGLFPDVDSRFKFCVLTGGGTERRFDTTTCAFYLHGTKELEDPDRVIELSPEDFARLNPNTRTAPVFRSRRDAELTSGIYSRLPVLIDRRSAPPLNPWRVRYATMFHMTNDSGLFRTGNQLEGAGFYPVIGNRWRKGEEEYIPLYEGKMVQMYDHRAASVVVNPDNVHRPGQPKPAGAEEHKNPAWAPTPQFWVSSVATRAALSPEAISTWLLAFKDVTSPTNERTMIASLIPYTAAGNTLAILLGPTASDAALLLAVLNSFAFDFVARQKVQGQHINLYILEQIAVPAPSVFETVVGGTRLADFVRDRVLRLTYTSHDLGGFARDLAYQGEPFAWDEEERLHLRCQLDALLFRLYSLDLGAADYVFSTFPIVKRNDEEQFGRYRTRDLVLAYMRAQETGDLAARIAL